MNNLPKTINFRTVTIWTTGVITGVTIAVPIIIYIILYFGVDVFVDKNLPLAAYIFGVLMFWLLSGGFLVAISYMIARKLKHRVPTIILLVSTIIYAILYVHAICLLCLVHWNGDVIRNCGKMSLLVMTPALILAVQLNSHYVKKTLSQGIARSTATSSNET